MIEFEKDTITGSFAIDSEQVLIEAETGRVVAVFFNDYDLDAVLKLQTELKEVKAKLAKAESDLSWAVVPEGAKF